MLVHRENSWLPEVTPRNPAILVSMPTRLRPSLLACWPGSLWVSLAPDTLSWSMESSGCSPGLPQPHHQLNLPRSTIDLWNTKGLSPFPHSGNVPGCLLPPPAPTSVPFLRSPSSSSQSLPDFVSSKFFQKVRKIHKLLARLIKTKRCKFEMLEAVYGTIGRGLKISGLLSYLIPCASSWQNGQFSQKMWTTNIDLRNRMWCSWVGGTMLQRCQSPTVPASLPGNPKGCEFVPIFTFL